MAIELGKIVASIDSSRVSVDLSVASFLTVEDGSSAEGSGAALYGDLVQVLKFVCPSPDPDALGELEGFELRQLVGVGPFGFVFQGWDPKLKRMVAIKVLSPSIAANHEKKSLFVDEARLTSSIRSPNVATIYHVHFSQSTGLAFFVMEWVEGLSLKNWLEKHSRGELVVNFFRQLVDAVAEIHANGIVHGDLKPGNVLIENGSNRLVVVDFGLAFENGEGDRIPTRGGTPLFMAPEQLQGKAASAFSDQFAVAEIACLMFYGFHPHKRDGFPALTEHVLSSDPDFKEERGLNPEVRVVLFRALSKVPEHRFGTIQEFGTQFLKTAGLDDRNQLQQQVSLEKRSWFDLPLERTGLYPAITFLGSFLFLVAICIFLTRSFSGEPVKSSSVEATPIQGQRGEWIGEDRYVNFAGLEFRRLKFDGRGLKNWPPDPDYPELFSELGWRNMNLRSLVGEKLVGQDFYDAIVNDREIDATSVSGSPPVTNVSLEDAEAFCRKLTARDPDGWVYQLCTVNSWSYAAYGKSILADQVPVAAIMDEFEARDRSIRFFSVMPDAFGDVLEWTPKEKKRTTGFQGVVSFDQRLPVAGDRFVEVVGGSQHDLFVHAFDMNFGINDHLTSSSGMEFHIEEDGETCYLHPASIGEEARLVYSYGVPPIVSAGIRSPFALFADNCQAGIRIRGVAKGGRMEEAKWENVLELNGKHFPKDNTMVDISQFAKGFTDLQVQYWIRCEDKRLRYAQFGRTSLHLKLPHVGSVELVTQNKRSTPRQSSLVPGNHKSSLISFRLMASPPKQGKVSFP